MHATVEAKVNRIPISWRAYRILGSEHVRQPGAAGVLSGPMTRAACVMWTVLLLGCGAGQKPESASGGVGEACPGTLQEALVASCRGMGAIDECKYEEATCGCSPHPYCGGATPEPPGPDDPGKYRCTSVDPASPLLAKYADVGELLSGKHYDTTEEAIEAGWDL